MGAEVLTMMDYIEETPQVLKKILDNRKSMAEPFVRYMEEKKTEQIYIIGSGTSCHAAIATKEFLEDIVGIRIIPMFPLPFMDQEKIFNCETLVIGISQSGNSMSTIHGLDKARALGLSTSVLAGMPDTEIIKHGDACVMIDCGEEKAVAKTKGYTATLLTLMLLGMELGLHRQTITQQRYDELLKNLFRTVDNIGELVNISIAWYTVHRDELLQAKNLLVVGYDNNLGTVMEGALKLLETVRIPVAGYEMEEFMHGIYNSINEDSYIFYINALGQYEERCGFLKSYMDKTTRHNYLIRSGKADESGRDIVLPLINDRYFSVLEYIIPMQCISYLLSCDHGIDPSRPSDPQFHKNMGSKIVV